MFVFIVPLFSKLYTAREITPYELSGVMGAVYHMNYSIGHFFGVAFGTFGDIFGFKIFALLFPLFLSLIVILAM